jgi:hypothetical protein
MPTPKNAPIKLTKAYIDKIKPPVEEYEHHWEAMEMRKSEEDWRLIQTIKAAQILSRMNEG